MAITGKLFNSLTFGDVNSSDYGIYISGEGVFNAPSRAVEMISVPGRNGAISLDLGRYDNITVEYPAGVFGDDNVNFRERLSDFRNAILAQKGYQRLTDTYHPEEFRMALYADGLEVAPVHYNEAGEFTLKFNCKPQRFLVEGEETLTITSGETITNPTLFESGPLFEVEGYGAINFNDYEIEFDPDFLGEIHLRDAIMSSLKENQTKTYPLDLSECLNGDEIFQKPGSVQLFGFLELSIPAGYHCDNAVVTQITPGYNSRIDSYAQFFIVRWELDGLVLFRKGTSSNYTVRVSFATDIKDSNDQVLSRISAEYENVVFYDGDSSTGISAAMTITQDYQNILRDRSKYTITTPTLWAYSTMSSLGHPTYIDCEIGEAYKYEDGEYISLNPYIDLGSDLPALAAGENEITFDNTISSLKVVPRWWKL